MFAQRLIDPSIFVHLDSTHRHVRTYARTHAQKPESYLKKVLQSALFYAISVKHAEISCHISNID